MLKRLSILLILLPVYCFALNLGKLQTSSYLYQPVQAEIPLNEIGSIPLKELQVGLASQSEFMRADMVKTNVVQALQFKIVQAPNHKPYIAVTSSERISEPVVSFLVKLSWSQGDYIKKYILLLNPPPATAPPTVNVAQTSETKPVQREYAKMNEQLYGPTSSNESLWSVAQKVRPSSKVTLDQTMLALIEYNPNAFLLHNVNGLMGGYYLRIPTIAQIEANSPKAAEQQMREHNRHWKNKTRVKITMKAAEAPTKPLTEPQQIVNSSMPTSATAAPVVVPVNAPAQAQLTTSNETQTAINNDEIISLRAQLDAAMKENNLFKQNNDQLTENLKTLTEKNSSLEAEITTAKQTIQRLQQLLNSQATVSVKAASKSSGFFASMMKNWGIIIGVIVILLLIVWFIIRRRKGQHDDDDNDKFINDLPDDINQEPINRSRKINVPDELNHADLDLEAQAEIDDNKNATIKVTKTEKEEEDDIAVEELLPDVTVTQVHRRNTKTTAEHAGDVAALLQEAKLYVDYGRTDQAKELLSQAMNLENVTLLQWEELLRIIVDTQDKQLFGRAVAKIPAPILSADDQALWQTVEMLRAKFVNDGKKIAIAEVAATKENATEVVESTDELTLSPLSEVEVAQLNSDVEVSETVVETTPAATSADDLVLKFTEDDEDDTDFAASAEDSDMSKLDLIHAYIEMGDTAAAKKLLNELITSGKPESKALAEKMLNDL